MRRFYTSLFGQVVDALVLGIVWPSFAVAPKPLGDAFIELTKMVVSPMVFGMVGAGDLRKVGRVGRRWSISRP